MDIILVLEERLLILQNEQNCLGKSYQKLERNI